MFVTNQAQTYPSNLHITRSTAIKFMPDRVCPWLPILDMGRKKNFKAYGPTEMHRMDKVQMIKNLFKLDTLFNNKGKLTRSLTEYDARSFWDDTCLLDSQGPKPSSCINIDVVT